jgi:hypothetical protein
MLGSPRGRNLDEADSESEEDVADEALVDGDKACHGIHSLLTGTSWDATTTLGRVVLGGDSLENTDAGRVCRDSWPHRAEEAVR